MIAVDCEVGKAKSPRVLQHDRRRRRRGFKADREEHNLPPRIGAGDLEAIEARVNHPNIGTLRLGHSITVNLRNPGRYCEAHAVVNSLPLLQPMLDQG